MLPSPMWSVHAAKVHYGFTGFLFELEESGTLAKPVPSLADINSEKIIDVNAAPATKIGSPGFNSKVWMIN